MKRNYFRVVALGALSVAAVLAVAAAFTPSFTQTLGGPSAPNVNTPVVEGTSGALFAITGAGLQRSVDGGANWTPLPGSVAQLAALLGAGGGKLYSFSGGSFYQSGDNGDTWSLFSSGLPLSNGSITINAIAADASNVYVLAFVGSPSFQSQVYRSPHSAAAFVVKHPAVSASGNFNGLAVAGANICVLLSNNGAYWSANQGDSWTSSGLSGNQQLIAVAPNGTDVYVTSSVGAAYKRSSNSCQSFSSLNATGLPAGSCSSSTKALGVDASGVVYRGMATSDCGASEVQRGIYKSANNGAAYSADNTGDMATLSQRNVPVYMFSRTSSGFFAGTNGAGLLLNGTGGWVRSNSGMKAAGVNAIAVRGAAGKLIAATDGGIFVTDNSGAAWTASNNGIADFNTSEVLVDGATLLTIAGQQIYRSTDDAATWMASGSGIATNQLVFGGKMLKGPDGIYLRANSKVYKSTDAGRNWNDVTSNLPSAPQLAADATRVYGLIGGSVDGNGAVGSNTGLWHTTDGAVWTHAANLGFAAGSGLFSPVFATGSALLTGGTDANNVGTLYRSTDNGDHWTATTGVANDQFGLQLFAFTKDAGGSLYVGDEHAGLSVSTDGGASWTPASDGLFPSGVCVQRILALAFDGAKIYAGQGGAGVFATDPAIAGSVGDSVACTHSATAGPDTTPDAFSFADQTGVAASTVITSNTITVSGITAATSIAVTGGSYSIGCTNSFVTSAGTIDSGSTVCVRHSSSARQGGVTDTTLTIGGVSDTFSSTTETLDTTPDAFAFADQANVSPSTVVTSDAITVSGINSAAGISVMGGSYSIGCGATFVTAAGTINNRDTVCVRHSSSANPGTATNTLLTIGGVADTFTSTTVSADSTPDAFTFSDQPNVAVSTVITSAPITISGINAPALVSVTGGSYSVGCTATYVSTAGSITNGQTLCAQHTSSPNASTATDTTLTIGGLSDTFTSTTAVASDSTPDAFSFADQTGAAPGGLVESNAITVTGINAAATISVSGGEYKISSGSYTSAAGTVVNGNTVSVRVTAGSKGASASATLSIGGVSGTFTVTSRSDAMTVTSGPGAGTTVSLNAGTITGLSNTATAPSGAPSAYSYPQGFFSFNVTGLANGATVTVMLSLPAGAAPTAYIKCNASGTTCSPFAGATFAGRVVSLTLVDGGAGDSDGVANGSISDPGAPAVAANASTAAQSGGSLGLLDALLGLLAALGFRRRALAGNSLRRFGAGCLSGSQRPWRTRSSVDFYMGAIMRNRILASLLLSLFLGGVCAQEVPPFDLNMDRVKLANDDNFAESRTYFIPTVYLHVSARSATGVKNDGARANARVFVTGLDKAMLQDLEKKIYDDLAAKIRAAGFTVLTYDDLKADMTGMDRMKPNAAIGFPTNLFDKGPGIDFAIITPSDEQAIDYSSIFGPVWQFRGIAKDRGLVVLVPQIYFNMPEVVGEKGGSISWGKSVALNILPSLKLYGATVLGLSPDAGQGLIQVQQHGKRLAAEVAGTIQKLAEDNSEFGSWSRTSGDFAFALEPTAFSTGVLRVGYAINDLTATTIKKAH